MNGTAYPVLRPPPRYDQLSQRVFQRVLAAFLAIVIRSALLRLLARASPPFRPSSTAALLLPFSVVPESSISPVAIRMTWTAFEITSAGRWWPFGVFGIAYR